MTTTVEQARARLAAIDLEAAEAAVGTAMQGYMRALSSGNLHALDRVSTDLGRAEQRVTEHRTTVAGLQRLIADAEASDPVIAFEGRAFEMRQLRQRGLEVAGKIHDAAERLVKLLDEFAEIGARLRQHNAHATGRQRPDLAVDLPSSGVDNHLIERLRELTPATETK